MKSGFLIELYEDRKPLHLSWSHRETVRGVIVNNETDAWPRAFALEFQGADLATKTRMDWVRRNNGWPSAQFRLRRFFRSGLVGFRGVTEKALPVGRYSIRVRMTGYEPSRQHRFRISKNEETIVRVNLIGDRRSVKLTREVHDFDPAIRKVVKGSSLDEMSLTDWLQDPTRRASRKACLLNILARLRSVPNSDHPLISQVKKVFFADVDRIYAAVGPRSLSRLTALKSEHGFDEDKPSPGHRKLLRRLRWEGIETKGYRLKSFREPGRPSMQLVVAVPPKDGSGAYFADLDIDLANPWHDVAGFIIHVGELIDADPTDHLALRRKLIRGAAKEFIYYTVRA